MEILTIRIYEIHIESEKRREEIEHKKYLVWPSGLHPQRNALTPHLHYTEWGTYRRLNS